MRTYAMLIAATATIAGCAANQPAPCSPAWAAPGPTLEREDVKARPDEVRGREAEQVARESFPGMRGECAPGAKRAWVRSSIRGSFTAIGAEQTMYFVTTYECDGLPSEHRDEVLIYQGGREIWRTAGSEPVRAKDVDGDGKDEWVEVLGKCDPECGTEAWLRGYEDGQVKNLIHINQE